MADLYPINSYDYTLNTSKQYNYDWHQYTANIPTQIHIKDSTQKFYEINLETRTINGPSILSIQNDHNAELLFFVVDRYYEYVDLADMCCVVQFTTTNVKNQEPFHGLYPIEYYDILTLDGKIIIPWSIPKSVTQSAQTVEYNFRFFSVDKDTAKLNYSLNTLPATAQILSTVPIYDDAYNIADSQADLVTYNYDRLLQLCQEVIQNETLYWRDAASLANQ